MLGLTRPGGGLDHREPTDVVRLVKEVITLVEKDMSRHRVRLDVKLTGEPSARVNPAQIQQVLLNLLINARQAMPEGGMVRVRLGLDAAGRRVELSVADTGVGIAPTDLRRIFEPFYSTKTGPDAAGQGGTGPGTGRLPRHRRGPSRTPPRREPPRAGLDLHADPPRLPARRRCRREARRGLIGRAHSLTGLRSASSVISTSEDRVRR